MSVTTGMSRREKLQYEARIRKMTGTSKLKISNAAHAPITEDVAVEALMRKLSVTAPATWGDGGAFSPESMYGTDEETAEDWSNSGLHEVAHNTMREDDNGY
jgi:hypothetical protein